MEHRDLGYINYIDSLERFKNHGSGLCSFFFSVLKFSSSKNHACAMSGTLEQSNLIYFLPYLRRHIFLNHIDIFFCLIKEEC